MCDDALRPCRICGAQPRVGHFNPSAFCQEYTCEIECPEGGHGKAVGASLDNAIEAQREAEERWNRLNEVAADLLPCPFCGGAASIVAADRDCFAAGCSGWDLGVMGYCRGHHIFSPRYLSRGDAAAGWNRRESPSKEGEDK